MLTYRSIKATTENYIFFSKREFDEEKSPPTVSSEREREREDNKEKRIKLKLPKNDGHSKAKMQDATKASE